MIRKLDCKSNVDCISEMQRLERISGDGASLVFKTIGEAIKNFGKVNSISIDHERSKPHEMFCSIQSHNNGPLIKIKTGSNQRDGEPRYLRIKQGGFNKRRAVEVTRNASTEIYKSLGLNNLYGPGVTISFLLENLIKKHSDPLIFNQQLGNEWELVFLHKNDYIAITIAAQQQTKKRKLSLAS